MVIVVLLHIITVTATNTTSTSIFAVTKSVAIPPISPASDPVQPTIVPPSMMLPTIFPSMMVQRAAYEGATNNDTYNEPYKMAHTKIAPPMQPLQKV